MTESEVDYATALGNLDFGSEQRQLDAALAEVLSMVDRGAVRDEVFWKVDNLSIDQSTSFYTALTSYAKVALLIRETALSREREKAD